MTRVALSLSSLIVSIVLLISGNAFLMTLLGLRLSLEGVTSGVIGWILVFYSVGFVAGTLYAGRVIESVGHIRAFAVFAAFLAAATLVYPMSLNPILWAGLRAVGGFVMAGLMIVMESWFSSRATNENRARLFAVYQVVFFLSTAGGQLLISVADPATYIPFSMAAILVSLALVPLALTRRASPHIEQGQRLSLRVLYQTSPIGSVGALVAGLLISAFYAMGPVYANGIGLNINQLSVFMAIAIFAAMILAWPVGRLCDRFNRYRVLFGAALTAAVSSLLAALAGNLSMVLLILLVGIYMGISAALYPIAVAITNDRIDNHQITAASTALLLSYGIGSIIGPLTGALFMELMGPAGLFAGNAAILGLFAAWAFQQGGWIPPTATEDQEHFYTHTPEATVGMAELDPRNPDFDAEEHHAPDAWANADQTGS